MVGQQDIWFLAGKHLDMGKESQVSQSDDLDKALKWVDQCTHWETSWAELPWGEGGQGAHMGEGVRESTPQKLSFETQKSPKHLLLSRRAQVLIRILISWSRN